LLHRAPTRVVLRRTRFQLKKAEERAEILEGYLIALANLDDFIKIIRAAKPATKPGQAAAFEWTQKQVEQWSVLIRNESR